jgi:hypothetical protein
MKELIFVSIMSMLVGYIIGYIADKSIGGYIDKVNKK